MMNLFTKSNDANARLGIMERLAYGCGLGGVFFVYYMPASYMTFYYTDVLMLNPAIIGSILLISRLFDGITDILMGFVFDRTHSKLGKSRFWVIVLCLPFVLSLILAFHVPASLTEMLKYLYVFVTYNFMLSVMFTAINLPLLCQPSLLTSNSEEHSLLGIYGQAIGTIPLLVVSNFTLKLVTYFGSTPAAWTITVAIYSGISLVLCLINFFGTKERVIPKDVDESNHAIPLSKQLYVLFRSKSWLAFTVAGIFFDVALCICSGARIYYARVILENTDQYTVMANFASWAQFFGLVFVSYLFIRKLGNGATFRFGAVLVGIGSLIQLYSGSTRLILLANMIVGIGFAAMLCTQYACNADLAGHLSDTVGFNVIGVASTGATFGAKIGNGLGSFILGLFLEIGHYKSTQTNFTAVTVKAIRGAYIWTPFICAVIVVILMYCFYHVDAELKAIQQKK